MDTMLFSLSIITPIFFIIFLGVVLRKFNVIDRGFVKPATTLIFNINLPALIFINIAGLDLSSISATTGMIIICISTVLVYIASWVISAFIIAKGESRGAFVQGSFRGEIAIIALAILLSLYGKQAVGVGALYLSLLLPVYIFLSVAVLSITNKTSGKTNYAAVFLDILKNPLILAVIAGLMMALSPLSISGPVEVIFDYLSGMTLPLALICIGISLHLNIKSGKWLFSLLAAIIKTVILPVITVLIAYKAGIRGEPLGVLFIISASPTTIASYIMASAMKSDGQMASQIVVFSTFISIFTLTAGIIILKPFL